MWPCRRGAIEKDLVRFCPPPPRGEVNRWKVLLETSPAIRDLPASGRAAMAVYEGFLKLLNWKTGRLEVSYEVMTGYARNYGRSTVAEVIRFLREHNIISVVPRCVKRFIAGGRFVREQVSNAYALLPPSQWKIPTTSRIAPAPAPTPDTMGYPEPVLTASDIHGLPGRKAEGLALMAESSCELERTLARWGLEIEAREARQKKKPPD